MVKVEALLRSSVDNLIMLNHIKHLQSKLLKASNMDIFEAVQARRSIRAYQDKPVPTEKLEKILEAARQAPSARNIEPWHFIVVTDQEKRKTLSKGLYAKFVTQAPLVIVACGNKKASSDWYTIDTALAMENLILTAIGEGLGTCCVGSFDEKEVAELLKVPDDFEVLLMITVGYPKEKLDLTRKLNHLVRPRKLLSEIASLEEYGKKLVPQKAVE
jgi:nitroreductase